jgi:hypothetical protein
MNLAFWMTQFAIAPAPAARTPSDNLNTLHTVIYRGNIYTLSKQSLQALEASQERRLALAGETFICSGATYQILPNEAAVTVLKTMHRLIYRGLIFERAI